MPAPKYNQYWKERKKHGRDKLFSNEDEIIELAQEYIEYCYNNPIKVQELVKGGQLAGETRTTERPRIPTIKGFAVFLGIDESTLYHYKNDEKYKDFFKSLAYVCDIFQTELAENAITGQANPMIAARLLGLKDKTDITSNDKEIPGIARIEFVSGEAKKISEDLDSSV